MLKANIYNLEGQVVGEQTLAPAVFEVKPKPSLIHFVAVGLAANERQVLAHTKTRGEVRGGGKKPWKQKGTGRARHSSIRSPLWRGGGITFGPRNDRNFQIKINKKVRKLAMKMVLSDKAKDESLILLENFDLAHAKTKNVAQLLKKLSLTNKKVLLILAGEKEKMRLASRNLPKIQPENLNEVNLLDILNNQKILTTPEAVAYWEKVYGQAN